MVSTMKECLRKAEGKVMEFTTTQIKINTMVTGRMTDVLEKVKLYSPKEER